MTKLDRRLYQEVARLKAGLAEIRDKTNPAPASEIAARVLAASKIIVPGSVDQSGDG